MRLRQEQVVLVATAVVLGLLLWRSGSDDGGRRPRSRSQEPPRFEDHLAPDVGLSLPGERRGGQAAPRDLFAPPRDSQPLPPLAIATPPLPPLTALRPPGVPGPAPAHFGESLRADPAPTLVPGLFLTDEADLADEALLEDALGDPAAAVLAATPQSGRDDLLTPDERAARLASWKRLYDWARVDAGEPLFGRISNPDRFGLAQRPKEALLFVQVDPKTGQDRFPGMEPVAFERERVAEFAFADTPSNWIQLRRREFLASMSPGRYPDLLAFAERCVELRLEAREALEVAAEMYQLAEGFAQNDPAPRLGLARCHEAAFLFEEAFEDYQSLLADFGHRAEVHVGLAELEARFRLFDSAEERLREAERVDRLSWRVQWAFGRFLHARGRFEQALAHLEMAYQAEPGDPHESDVRAGIRNDLGRALLALGRIDEALGSFERALQAQPAHAGAQAGVLACRRLQTAPAGTEETSDAASLEQAGFELLLATGLSAIDQGRPEEARDLLAQAASADPLRSASALGAGSWLAETTGYPEEAYRLVEEAHTVDPEDAWVLYQRGRLAAQRDDLDGAREALVAALDVELDFPDALIALADLARRTGELSAADLYLERALQIDPDRAEVHALRGIGLLELGDVGAAEESLRTALERDPEQALAAAGLAWVAYRRGDSERAVRLFAELDDRRRALPEDEPYRAFARAQIERIRDHESKEVWTDRFERRELRNDWVAEEATGPLVAIVDGALTIRGDFRENGEARILRQYAAPDFVAVEMSVTVEPENNARVGLFVSKERRRGAGQVDVQGIVAIARRKDGGLIVRTEDRAAAEPQWEDVPPVEGVAWWPAGKPVRLRIEVTGEGSAAVGRIVVDGLAVRDGFPMRGLASSTNELRVGVFVEGQTGLPASVTIDDVQVVRRVTR